MSCNTNEEVRIIMKYSTITGAEPTIPLSGDHEDGTWLPTDLYTGEFFMNAQDNKLWIRTDNGIVEVGGTVSGTSSFIGDYVHISGGTYSGDVYAPTFSSLNVIATNIYGDNFSGASGSATFTGNFIGDGSLLTGIICDWLGGTVSNPVHFTDRVDLTNDIYIDGGVYTNNTDITFNSDLQVTGGMSASIFYGDGSGLTNLPTGTYSDTYTSTAALSGNQIIFTRNDASDYSVDLTPILASQSISMVQWNDTTNLLTLTLNDDTELAITIDTFANLNSTGPITAPEFYGGVFYGEFVGTFSGVTGSSGVAGTLEQTLALGNDSGTQSIVMGTATSIITNGGTGRLLMDNNGDGDTVKIDASHLSAYGRLVVDGYGEVNLLGTDGTNTSIVYVNEHGVQVSTDSGRGIEYNNDYSATYTNRSLVDKEYVDTHGATGLAGVLEIGSNSGENSIFFPNMQGIRNSNGVPSSTGLGFDNDGIYIHAGTGSVDDYGPKALITLTKTGEIGFGSENAMSFNLNYNGLGTGTFDIYGYPGFRGVVYGADYSANYTNRSLVDKEYVDTHSSLYTYITENTTAGTLTMSTPTSTTSTVTDGTIINGDYNGLDYSRKSYDNGLYTTELIMDPLGGYDQTLFGEKYNAGGTQGSIRFSQGGQAIDITTTDGLVVTLGTQYNLTTPNIVTTATNIDETAVITQTPTTINNTVTGAGGSYYNDIQYFNYKEQTYNSSLGIARAAQLFSPDNFGVSIFGDAEEGRLSVDATGILLEALDPDVVNRLSGIDIKKDIIKVNQRTYYFDGVDEINSLRTTSTKAANSITIGTQSNNMTYVDIYQDTIAMVKVYITGMNDAGTKGYSAEMTASFRYNGDIPTQIGTTDMVVHTEFSTASTDIYIDGGYVFVKATGEVGETINWSSTTEVRYNEIYI